jgi:hypothetical protein
MTTKVAMTTVGAVVVGGSIYVVNVRDNVTAARTSQPDQAVYSLPAWALHGTQPEHWTEAWRQKELLADFDWAAGNTSETDDVEELIRQLHEAAGE